MYTHAITALAPRVLQRLIDYGVQEFVVCPGARNAPLVETLAQSSYKRWLWPEERSAAFFALGRAKRLGAPVAVVTTSGTAVGELLPAMMEAYYAHLPLVAVTADRPRAFRKTGAPQSVEQVAIFGPYAPFFMDIAEEEEVDLTRWDRKSPCHLNICLEEPKVERSGVVVAASSYVPATLPAISFDLLTEFLEQVNHPLVVVGGLTLPAAAAIKSFLLKLQAPLYCEAPSQLRRYPELMPLRVHEPSLQHYDSVLRLGSVPTHRLWRDLEAQPLPTLSISEQPFSGLTHGALMWGDLAPFFTSYSPRRLFALPTLSSKPSINPHSEPALLSALAEKLPANSHVYLGNSLPIREWDLAVLESSAEVTASRGANGIDGQLSCFFGLCRPDSYNMAIVGDLTALYDLVAPWILPSLDIENVIIVVINNGGGKIFHQMGLHQETINRHTHSFKGWAELWGLSYRRTEQIPEQLPRGHTLLEIVVRD